MTTIFPRDNSRLSRAFGFERLGLDIPDSISVMGDNIVGWLANFRLGAVDRAKGLATKAVELFQSSIDNMDSSFDTYAHFLTACTVLGKNIELLKEAKLLDEYGARRARASLVELQTESAQAHRQLALSEGHVQDMLKGSVGDLVGTTEFTLDRYAQITSSTSARLNSFGEFLENMAQSAEPPHPASTTKLAQPT